MTAKLVTIASGIVTALNGKTFSQTFTAARLWAPSSLRKDLSGYHVTIKPLYRITESPAILTASNGYKVILGIRTTSTALADPTDFDPVAALAEEVVDFLLGKTISGLYLTEVRGLSAEEMVEVGLWRETGLIALGYELTYTETADITAT
jgi:hypothetical protein